jgi:hypothetical protein
MGSPTTPKKPSIKMCRLLQFAKKNLSNTWHAFQLFSSKKKQHFGPTALEIPKCSKMQLLKFFLKRWRAF